MSGVRIGLDIGGTFTDFVLVRDGGATPSLHKVLTTPEDPAIGALRGLREVCAAAGVRIADVDVLVHGTTLVTNAIIERNGVPTGLLTTAGFRDVLEMGTEQRYDIYDLFLQYPEPLVPRRWRLEVEERLTRDGEVRRALDAAAVERLGRRLVDAGVQAVAVSFLHAYRNPAHEREAGRVLRERFPSLAVSLSHEVCPEIREYPRTVTTVCNAYVQPLVDRYLRGIETALRADGFRGRFYLMQSTGGTMTPDAARAWPVRLLESGPAGGALAAAFFGERAGERDVVGFDMGGTTAKICLIQDGVPSVTSGIEAARVHRFKKGSGIPVKTPVVDMIEIGAGGGSVARRDVMGLLKVGPHSAGAKPGPASYGFGGTDATVTDACLRLGYFDARSFLGGEMPLDAGAAREALARVGAAVGLDDTQVAWGIHNIVCENMAAAARVYLIERGEDPRRFALVAFGGAGPAHAARVARLLGVRRVLVPPASGVASAVGFLVAPISFDFSHSLPGSLLGFDWEAANRLLAEMEREGRRQLADAGVGADGVTIERFVDMRFHGQFHELSVPLPDGPLSEASAGALAGAFETAYRRLYGSILDGMTHQVLNWRLRAAAPQPALGLVVDAAPVAEPAAARTGERLAYFPEANGYVLTAVYGRDRLARGAAIDGPAIVEEREATTVVTPSDRLVVDDAGNLNIWVGERS